MRFFICFLVVLVSFTSISFAEDKVAVEKVCEVDDRACVIDELTAEAAKIDNKNRRDQIYREASKTLAFDKKYDEAISLWEKIESPDTKALTIRGIGMAAAENGTSGDALNDVFVKLRAKSETIKHPPSYAIALTYIAMAQAFAGDDEGAWSTAADMENDALRHKAYGETAEIQAEHGKFDAAMKSIGMIDSSAYRNKSYSIVSKILADKGHLAEALKAAQAVTNSYKKANALQYVLDKQKPRELPK